MAALRNGRGIQDAMSYQSRDHEDDDISAVIGRKGLLGGKTTSEKDKVLLSHINQDCHDKNCYCTISPSFSYPSKQPSLTASLSISSNPTPSFSLPPSCVSSSSLMTSEDYATVHIIARKSKEGKLTTVTSAAGTMLSSSISLTECRPITYRPVHNRGAVTDVTGCQPIADIPTNTRTPVIDSRTTTMTGIVDNIVRLTSFVLDDCKPSLSNMNILKNGEVKHALNLSSSVEKTARGDVVVDQTAKLLEDVNRVDSVKDTVDSRSHGRLGVKADEASHDRLGVKVNVDDSVESSKVKPIRYQSSASTEKYSSGAGQQAVVSSRHSNSGGKEQLLSSSSSVPSLLSAAATSSSATSNCETITAAGLTNLGNTCFMNSVLQCLLHSRPLLEYCQSGRYRADVNRTTSCMKGALINAYVNLTESIADGNDLISPHEFKSQIGRFAQRFLGYSQHDAHEFLMYLLEGLHEDLNRASPRTQSTSIHTASSSSHPSSSCSSVTSFSLSSTNSSPSSSSIASSSSTHATASTNTTVNGAVGGALLDIVNNSHNNNVSLISSLNTNESSSTSETSSTAADAAATASWNKYITSQNSQIIDIFAGHLRSTLTCRHCGYSSDTLEPFLDLSLSIDKSVRDVSLQDCLQLFMQEETLDGEERPVCEQCKTRQSCTKRFSIHRFPQVLIIHLTDLKRFSQGYWYTSKLQTLVKCPKTLDLSLFLSKPSPMHTPSHPSSLPPSTHIPSSLPPPTQVMYSLYAVSNHNGSTNGGHYTAVAKQPYTDQWHLFNDARVTDIAESKVITSDAYILFYELVETTISRL